MTYTKEQIGAIHIFLQEWPDYSITTPVMNSIMSCQYEYDGIGFLFCNSDKEKSFWTQNLPRYSHLYVFMFLDFLQTSNPTDDIIRQRRDLFMKENKKSICEESKAFVDNLIGNMSVPESLHKDFGYVIDNMSWERNHTFPFLKKCIQENVISREYLKDIVNKILDDAISNCMEEVPFYHNPGAIYLVYDYARNKKEEYGIKREIIIKLQDVYIISKTIETVYVNIPRLSVEKTEQEPWIWKNVKDVVQQITYKFSQQIIDNYPTIKMLQSALDEVSPLHDKRDEFKEIIKEKIRVRIEKRSKRLCWNIVEQVNAIQVTTLKCEIENIVNNIYNGFEEIQNRDEILNVVYEKINADYCRNIVLTTEMLRDAIIYISRKISYALADNFIEVPFMGEDKILYGPQEYLCRKTDFLCYKLCGETFHITNKEISVWLNREILDAIAPRMNYEIPHKSELEFERSFDADLYDLRGSERVG